METIDQHTKGIMEECKKRAADAGLNASDETLEYLVTNQDLLKLSPKIMIPTLYDYWVHDIQVHQENARYKLYPNNPYESVINSRPPISFYNDNNPDWFNIMIFYHVMAHIDFFQNNAMFKNTWNEDFVGKALADKRRIAGLRDEHGRMVDYVIEFTRGLDNIVGYYDELADLNFPNEVNVDPKMKFYFDVFLQDVKEVTSSEFFKESERYNDLVRRNPDVARSIFFAEIQTKYPEFDALYEKREEKKYKNLDVIQFIMENSKKLNFEENRWMKSVMQIVRDTSMYFQPQLRTKIMNEGWASYWHENLILKDERIKGHEVDIARMHARVTAIPRVGLNPYAIGMRLFEYIKMIGDTGRNSFEFMKLKDIDERKKFDLKTGKGDELIFKVRSDLTDYLFIQEYIDQDFVNQHKLFVVGRKPDYERMVWKYYVKSRKAEDYKKMILGALAHPPDIQVNRKRTTKNILYLEHNYEGKPLKEDWIHNTMLGAEFLWDGPVVLKTNDVSMPQSGVEPVITPVIYKMHKRTLVKKEL